MVRKSLLFVLFVSLLAACQSPNATRLETGEVLSESCQTIEHDAGETKVCDRPERIIALGPYLLEALVALDMQPVGFADHISLHQGTYNNPSRQIPYLGREMEKRISERALLPMANVGSAFTPSMEAILKLQPDLIVGTDANVEQYEALSQIAPTLLFEWGDTAQTMSAIGQAVERSEKAAQVISEMEVRIAEARETFSPLVAARPKVALLSASQLTDVTLAESAFGPCRALVEEIGFQLVEPSELKSTDDDMPAPFSLEALPHFNEADSVIFLSYNFSNLGELEDAEEFTAHQFSALKQAWENNAIAQSLTASKNDQVHFIPSYICLGLTGPIGTDL